MSELIRILLEALEEAEVYDENGNDLDPQERLAIAQRLAEAVIAHGWPER